MNSKLAEERTYIGRLQAEGALIGGGGEKVALDSKVGLYPLVSTAQESANSSTTDIPAYRTSLTITKGFREFAEALDHSRDDVNASMVNTGGHIVILFSDCLDLNVDFPPLRGSRRRLT